MDEKFYPATNKLEDLEGKPVEGTFYIQELVRARNTGVYFVRIIKKKKIYGKLKYLISWPEYPNASNEWKAKAQLQKIV